MEEMVTQVRHVTYDRRPWMTSFHFNRKEITFYSCKKMHVGTPSRSVGVEFCITSSAVFSKQWQKLQDNNELINLLHPGK